MTATQAAPIADSVAVKFLRADEPGCGECAIDTRRAVGADREAQQVLKNRTLVDAGELCDSGHCGCVQRGSELLHALV